MRRVSEVSYPGLRPIWSRNHAHTSQLFSRMPWKTKWDQFTTLMLLKRHSSVFLSHIYYNDVVYLIMGRFLREPDQERLHNAAKMESWYSQTSKSMQSVDTNACIQFWNRKAEEICHSPSYAKWPKNTITAVIATEWSVKKPPCFLITPRVSWIRSQKETISANKKWTLFTRALWFKTPISA